MTKKRSGLFRFILKSVLGVLCLFVAAVLALNLWSRWEVRQAQAAFETVVAEKPRPSAVHDRSQLRAAAIAASRLNLQPDEKKRIGGLAALPLEKWTAQDDALVAQVTDRNRDVLNSVALALVPNLPEDSKPQTDPASSDVLDRSPIEIHIQSILAARVFAAEGRRAFRTGGGRVAIQRLLPLKHFADGFEDQESTLDVLWGLTSEQILGRCLLDMIGSGGERPSLDRAEFSALVPEVDLTNALRSTLHAETISQVQGVAEAENDPSLQGKYVAPIIGPTLKRLLQAAFLETGTSLLKMVDTPFASDMMAFSSPPEPPRWNLIQRAAHIRIPTMLTLIARTQATAAQRQLLDAALVMSTTPWPGGAYPEARPEIPALNEPDPFSGQLLEYQLLDDGRLRLAVANGPELLDAIRVSGKQNWLDPVVLGAPPAE